MAAARGLSSPKSNRRSGGSESIPRDASSWNSAELKNLGSIRMMSEAMIVLSRSRLISISGPVSEAVEGDRGAVACTAGVLMSATRADGDAARSSW